MMPRRTSTDERDDVALLLGCDRELGAFYRRYERPVLGYFLRRTGRPELAADLAAETFARVIESRGRFRPELGEPRAWLFAIARNVLTRSYDLGRVEDVARREVAMQPLVFEDGDLLRIPEQSEELAIEALRLLPADQAEAVKGRIVDELGYDALAAQLGCSESVVRKRVSRGLRGLRMQLEGRR